MSEKTNLDIMKEAYVAFARGDMAAGCPVGLSAVPRLTRRRAGPPPIAGPTQAAVA